MKLNTVKLRVRASKKARYVPELRDSRARCQFNDCPGNRNSWPGERNNAELRREIFWASRKPALTVCASRPSRNRIKNKKSYLYCINIKPLDIFFVLFRVIINPLSAMGRFYRLRKIINLILGVLLFHWHDSGKPVSLCSKSFHRLQPLLIVTPSPLRPRSPPRFMIHFPSLKAPPRPKLPP